jgi:hypothetical protein
VTGYATALTRARAVRAVLLDHGVPEVSIELQPGRPMGRDDWNSLDPVAVLSHHIASNPTVANPTPGLSLVKRGRSDLPGPLCNGTAGVDLVYRIICLGYANHSGFGGPLTVSGPLGSFTIPKDNGRAYLWGTEYEGGYTNEVWDKVYTNRRTGKTMTFREFMGRCNAGLVEAIWLPGLNSRGKRPTPGMDLSGYHGEHKTWAPGRKPDRKDYTTESGRAEVRRFNEIEDDMPTPKDLWDHKIQPLSKDKDGNRPNPAAASVVLAQAHNRAGEARAHAVAAHAQAVRNRAAIRAIGDRLDGLAPGIAAAVVQALGDTVEPGPSNDE